MSDDVPLKEYLESRIDALEKALQERYDTQTKALDAALKAAEQAVGTALVSAEKAVTKAEIAADKRFELLNELRVGVATKEQVEAVDKRVGDLMERFAEREGTSKGISSSMALLISLIGVVGVVVSIFVATR